jgi:hypothetical protein
LIFQDLSNHLFHNPHTNFGETVQGPDDVNGRISEARQIVLRFFNTDSSQYQVSGTWSQSHDRELQSQCCKNLQHRD